MCFLAIPYLDRRNPATPFFLHRRENRKTVHVLAILLFASVLMVGCGGDSTESSSTGPASMDTPAASIAPLSPDAGTSSQAPPSQTRPAIALTPDVHVTDDSRRLAAALGNDAVRIFRHVQNTVEFEPYYYGSLKGSQETLLQKAGNDYDIASLLVSLFNSSGIESRYAQATVRLPVSEAMSWLGVESAATAEKILQAIEPAPGAEGFKSKLVEGGAAIEFPHVWVEARLGTAGQEWTALDPSFKLHSLKSGRNIAKEAGLSGQTLLESILDGKILDLTRAEPADFIPDPARPDILPAAPDIPSMTLPNTISMQAVMSDRLRTMANYLRSHQPSLTMRDIMGGKEIIADPANALPASLPFTVQGEVRRFTAIPDSERHVVQVFFQGINTTLPLPEIADKRVTLSFAPATESDQAKIGAAGGIIGSTANSINLKPQLRIDGVVRAEGFGLGLGASLTNFMQLTFRRGNNVLHTATHQNLTVGGHYAIVFDTQKVSTEKIRRSNENLRRLNAASAPIDEAAPELLHLLELIFFDSQDRFTEYAAGTQNVVAFQGVNEALIGLDVAVGPNQQISLGRLRIDNQRNAFEFFSRSGDPAFDPAPLRFVVIAASSSFEDSVFRTASRVPAISSVRILARAADTGTRIIALNSTNRNVVLPRIGASPLVRGFISVAADQGRTVLIPEQPTYLADWSGTGWIEYPLGTSTGGFNISGNIAGGEVVLRMFTGTRQEQEQAFRDTQVFAVTFVDGFLFGDRAGQYTVPAGQAGRSYGSLISGFLVFGDIRDTAYAVEAIGRSRGQEGWRDLGFAAVGFLAGGDVLKYADDLSEIRAFEKAAKEASERAARDGSQAVVSKIVPGGGLRAHENGPAGHTIDKHVGKSKEFLEQRLREDPRPARMSSYYDEATAEAAISDALAAKKEEIGAFMASSKSFDTIRFEFDTPVGYSLARGDTELVPASKVFIRLDKDPTMPTGYRIKTSYPYVE